jgi:hypothetical protein
MVNAALRWPPQRNRHVQGPDRQVAFHPVADGPTDDAPRMQIEDDSQIEPTLLRPDIADVTGPLPGCRFGVLQRRQISFASLREEHRGLF